jgi:hypothetical protein
LRRQIRRRIAGTAVKTFYTDHFILPLPEGHRFPMRQYALFREHIVETALVPPADLRVARLVFDNCPRTGVPVAVSMAGGYARRVEDTVAIHLQTVREAAARATAGAGG